MSATSATFALVKTEPAGNLFLVETKAADNLSFWLKRRRLMTFLVEAKAADDPFWLKRGRPMTLFG